MKSEMEKLREKQQRRRRRRTLRILALSPLIALVFVAVLSLFTRINTVIVRNPTVYSSLDIAEHFSFSVGDSLFTVNRNKMAEEISIACPYVKSAQVSYKLPSDLEITLIPATVAFAVRTETEVLLIDRDFKVLEVVDRIPAGVVAVEGMEIVSYTVGYPLDENENIQVSIVRELLAELEQRGLDEHTSRIDLSKKYNISLRIYDVITVYMGNSENFDAKMNMLVKLLNENDVTVPAEIRVRNPAEGRYIRLDPLPDSSADTDSETEKSPASDTNG